jgi:hypothetical protein
MHSGVGFEAGGSLTFIVGPVDSAHVYVHYIQFVLWLSSSIQLAAFRDIDTTIFSYRSVGLVCDS